MFSDYPIPGETLVYDDTHKIDIDNTPLEGGALLEVTSLSIDPYQRGRMNRQEGYRASFQLGEP